MKENEIREYIEELRHKANTLIKSGYATSGISTHFNKSADLIEELLEYKLNGSFSGVELAQLAAMQMRLRDYQKIGTIDEFKVLKEKNEPKEPDYEGDGCWDGHVVIDTWICPNCGKSYEVDYDDYDYCPNCGQHIDHSGLTEDD